MYVDAYVQDKLPIVGGAMVVGVDEGDEVGAMDADAD
jgi:hypothetical protein